MTYIILVAGKGTRLHPLTLMYPKCMYKLDNETTVLERMVTLIRKYDGAAEIVLVTGFMDECVRSKIKDATYVFNPFYSVTNSMASIWFAREYCRRDNVTVINGDIVLSEEAVRDVLVKPTDRPYVLLDGSIKNDGDYNVQTDGDRVVVMSKNLASYYGEYAGISKFDSVSISDYLLTLDEVVREEQFDQWYEDIIVRMIFRDNYAFYYQDISAYEWTEVDNVDDMVRAKKIHNRVVKI